MDENTPKTDEYGNELYGTDERAIEYLKEDTPVELHKYLEYAYRKAREAGNDINPAVTKPLMAVRYVLQKIALEALLGE